jgi:CheY-like chemotaxis protein
MQYCPDAILQQVFNKLHLNRHHLPSRQTFDDEQKSMEDKKQLNNTLRINSRQLDALVDKIDANSDSTVHPNREYVRWKFRKVTVVLTLESGGGNKKSLPVVTRNISSGGMSILHSAYVYPDSRCYVSFNSNDNEIVTMPGKVVRCGHIGGKVHEVGVQFDEQIGTRELLGLDPMEEAYSLERVNPELLGGTVLIVTGSEMDREILTQFLQETQMTIRVAATMDEAIERAKKGCDLIFADHTFGEHTVVQLISGCREEGIDVPILVMTSDESAATRDTLRMAGASGYFSKPIDQQRLYQAIAEFLLNDGSGGAGPLYTSLTSTDSAYSLLGNFYSNMPKLVVGLERAMRDGEYSVCCEICRTLAGTATPLGFEPVGDLALAADRALSKGSKVSDAALDIRSLLIACRRIRVTPAA